jgi:hypothetical protein
VPGRIEHLPSLELSRQVHASLLFETDAERKEFALPFIHSSLSEGAQCFYITPAGSTDEWLLEFQAYGIDVANAVESGSLSVLNPFLRPGVGHINSARLAGDIWRAIQPGLIAFNGVSIAVDMGLTLDAETPADELTHWEATFDLLLDGIDCRVVCMYELGRLPPAAIHAALRTHSRVIFRGRVLANPYYEARRILENEPYLNPSDVEPSALQAMLATLASSPDA